MLNVRVLTLIGIVLAAGALRLLPHPPNFNPIMAMALFGGAYFASRKLAFVIPLAALAISDVFLGHLIYGIGWFYEGMLFVYASFALTVCLGLLIRGRSSPFRIGIAAVSGSCLFFIMTNFGTWLTGLLYPRTVEGLVACYVAAIPFFANTLLGDLFYTVMLFGGFAVAQRYISPIRKESVPAV